MTTDLTPAQLADAERAERLAAELIALMTLLAERIALLAASLEATNASMQDLTVTIGADDHDDPEALVHVKPSPSGKH